MSDAFLPDELPAAAIQPASDHEGRDRPTEGGTGLIRIRGARQHNLKNIDLDIRTGELTVVTGPSGSGKSSLVFDTLFAEGQRRYVETFSAYARQFLDRMDKPAVDRVEGVPPAIAIDQTNPVRSSRSTVGTMTELNDHLKLLFARGAELFDRDTAALVRHDSPESIYAELSARAAAQGDPRLVVTFPVELPASTTPEEIEQWLSASGYTRVQAERVVHRAAPAVDDKVKTKGKAKAAPMEAIKVLDVVADRFRIGTTEPARVMEAIEVGLKRGGGKLMVYALKLESDPQLGAAAEPEIWRFSTGLHCPESDIRYSEPTPSMFSFNSAVGACEACRGFGRVIGVDYGLVIPNDKLTLRAGAIKVFQTPAWKEAQDDMMRHAEAAGIPRDTPWAKLTDEQKHWVKAGSPQWNGKWNQHWYGVDRFFEYLESKAYKMHIRVLLSKYRSYTECPSCGGARLKTDSLLWRLGTKAQADAVLPVAKRYLPKGVKWSRAQVEALPGLCLHDLMLLPLDRLRTFFASLAPSPAGQQAPIPTFPQGGKEPNAGQAQALKLLLDEINTRIRYLCEVGIGYLTLDRQSRTLSGGEVQRINLTTALGTSLVNTLFVLDEPSIGLHPRDMARIVDAMLRLRDAGNTLVVVEHDPAVMLAADRLIDMGPGPGERGGQIVFDGTPESIRSADTLTGAYLGARKTIGMGFKRAVTDSTPRLILEGAREHNLKDVSVEFPLQRLVVVTGVSGSGKSSLIQDVLAPALLRHFGKSTDTPGAFDRLLGAEQLSEVVFVDQSPIGKTARSNPVSYVGAWDAIRALFADAPLSRQRSYTPAKFSFNSGDGRCPTCGGSGFEHVEMQFLSDVYLRCPDCDGKRYRPEILEVRIERGDRSLNVADVLDLTVSEAAALFANDREVIRVLQPIVDVGLEYVKLGQPVPTLSGGEAQRLKLAGFLAEASKSASASRQPLSRKGTLFLFDEPTTGLHFDDIAKLMRSLRKLLDAGHSLVVIEHNLDVIRSADWLIDLGPEGGDAGGLVVAEGAPEQVREHASSHTAKALREYALSMGEVHAVREGRVADYLGQSSGLAAAARRSDQHGHAIRIVNAKEHNLKNLSVNIPRGKFNVISGVSGSGKSTLAFDILFNEGQRRYLESLNAYARSIVQPAGRPEVDAVYGIPPTVAIEQRLSRGGRKSTVGTTTEVWHFLRLLYVKLGTQHCVHDGAAVMPQSADSIAASILKRYAGQHIGLLAPLVVNRKGVYTELADWARPRGHTHLRVDGEFLPTTGFPRIDRFKEHTIELPVADFVVNADQEAQLRSQLAKALEIGKGVVHVLHPLDGLARALEEGASTRELGRLEVFSTTRACPVCATSYPELDPRLFSYNSKHGWCPDCVGTGLKLSRDQRSVLDDSVRDDRERGREQSFAEPEVEDLVDEVCPGCEGTRLNAQARAVKFSAVGITDVARLSVREVRSWVQGLMKEAVMSTRETGIARDLLPEIESRLAFLEEVGLNYLTLDRGAPTLSGGEAQRIRLAAQLGSNLQGVCYVLDEPTIGLHARDNAILLNALHKLGDMGNTLVVVEHDEDTIRRADHIIDIGPSAGKRGGRVVAQGSVDDLSANPESVTGRYLLHAMKHPLQPRREVTPLDPFPRWGKAGMGAGAPNAAAQASPHPSPPPAGEEASHWLQVHRAQLHNLNQLDAAVPLQRLVVITGVSGSGKSTLARDVLLTNVAAAVAQRSTKAGRDAMDQGQFPAWSGCASVSGFESVDRVLEVDQTPIGKTPRSCPATYIGFWDTVRKLFADTLEAKARGYGPGRFSFNTGEGRCPGCEGQGMRTIEMSFLPDVKVPCEVCHGARFNPETLAVTWKGKSIGDVLQMEVDEAVDFFASMPSIGHPLQLLKDVGLGYLTLGQPSPTLSGGEAQRIKLVTELSKVRDDITRRGQKPPHTLYVLDEPTVGLHMADVEKLIRVLHRLVDGGHSVVVIEHDLDVMAEADWIIDLGPEGGGGGGLIVAAAPPDEVVRLDTHTGRVLGPVLARA
ncbi:excinuclease ABC subunit UvrA [Hydrogenophaga sp. PBL-H3]|uniref:excinuclease ABC subunit UvrA n=1 Tax=Hydrogenophaga sp. PBL-H3 TaxID=434010 RepID=UPI0013204DD0|nr:excinuclease ABC subunit UvrA [Hydrogenophaga sp. PBL-H3]QHE77880.1 excinuclease ABC subunit A [Hydrogenophaga sp. PBL-H3]QHE82304.1 excinuclease ABC subunit A [Hydrogenophaga sp. PBL-H3]